MGYIIFFTYFGALYLMFHRELIIASHYKIAKYIRKLKNK